MVVYIEDEVANFTRQEMKDYLQIIKDKVVIIKFYADWCNPCKKADPIIQNYIQNKDDDWYYIKINVDNSDELMHFFRVSKLPTLLSYIDGDRMMAYEGADEGGIERFFKKNEAHLSF